MFQYSARFLMTCYFIVGSCFSQLLVPMFPAENCCFVHSLKLTAKAPENGWLEDDKILVSGK